MQKTLAAFFTLDLMFVPSLSNPSGLVNLLNNQQPALAIDGHKSLARQDLIKELIKYLAKGNSDTVISDSLALGNHALSILINLDRYRATGLATLNGSKDNYSVRRVLVYADGFSLLDISGDFVVDYIGRENPISGQSIFPQTPSEQLPADARSSANQLGEAGIRILLQQHYPRHQQKSNGQNGGANNLTEDYEAALERLSGLTTGFQPKNPT